MAKLTGQGLVEFAKSLVGTPYFYGSKLERLTNSFMLTMHKYYPSVVTDSYMKKAEQKGMVGKICVDCSGLIAGYRKKDIGSSQLYATAYKKIPTNQYVSFPNGTVVWRQGHVGVFSCENNEYYVYEAKGIDYGTVKSEFVASKWSYGLLFSDIDYTVGFVKMNNPYKNPKTDIVFGDKNDGVRWLQWELNEAGFDLDIDGDFGNLTKNALKQFQQSCKLKVTAIADRKTRSALIKNGK